LTRKAAERGEQVFAYRIRQDWKDNGRLSRELTNVGATVEAIEREGWQLQHVGYYGSESKPSGVYLFRAARNYR
jgi:hypothetical protein